MTNSQSQNDPLDGIPSDRLWLRSELMGTQVITRDTGRRLGVVGEVVVDIDRREVVALGLRDNPLTRFLPGLPRWMPLDRIRQVGDVILVDSVDSLSEGFTPDRYSRVINCQVITESGDQLGRVLGFSFDIETGELTTLVMGALGVPILGEGVLSTWEIPVEEIVSSGADRIIVYEGAEEKLKQLNSGFLEKLGVGGSSWEDQERDRYRVNLVPVENQLISGDSIEEPQRSLQASTQEIFQEEEELEYVEIDQEREEIKQKRRYLDEPSISTFSDSGKSIEDQPAFRDNEEYEKSQAFNKGVIPSRSTSRRPNQKPEDPLDVEPLDTSPNKERKFNDQLSPYDDNELEDPW
nr:PRC-barrel domain-containing protein [Prochlorococcus sp. MIT 1307]